MLPGSNLGEGLNEMNSNSTFGYQGVDSTNTLFDHLKLIYEVMTNYILLPGVLIQILESRDPEMRCFDS